MSTAPVQVILNADNYRRDRETQPPASSGTDFFLGRGPAFAQHRAVLTEQVTAVRSRLTTPAYRAAYGSSGYARVQLRPEAWAKSHRPTSRLFRPNVTPTVGADQLGEMICRVTPEGLNRVNEWMARAEVDARTRVDRRTGEIRPNPSRARCEVGAIESIELWDRSRRRRFTIERAIDWLAQEGTGHGYLVELFEPMPSPAALDAFSVKQQSLLRSFRDGLASLGLNLSDAGQFRRMRKSNAVQIRMMRAEAPLSAPAGARRDETYIDDPDAHRALIGFLETHPLVREIRLPARVVRSSTPAPAAAGASAPVMALPQPVSGTSYPQVGIIDGGVAPSLGPWVRHEVGLLDPMHTDLGHGTFIAGLLVAGASQNPALGLEPDGCVIDDLNIFPDTAQAGVIDLYFPNGSSDFFDEVEAAIAECREKYRTRIFNLSINAVVAADLDQYSPEARRLDEIAEEHDVVIVVSAGNLDAPHMRTEWPEDATEAAQILAAKRNDSLFVPAESVRNISVAALNPTGMSTCIAEAPARYSRRGPGLRTGVKPDLSHFGGAGTNCPTSGTGLASLDATGMRITDCGTSYAAPLVAKTLALLDHAIEGDVSRETLTALAVHGAITPQLLKHKAFKRLSTQLVGFGRPRLATEILEGSPHEITMLFSSRIMRGKMLEFYFAWPPSLVEAGGKCRGDVRLTLASTPPLDYRFGPEFIRANIDAALQQELPDGKFERRLEPTHVLFLGEQPSSEKHLIEHQLKWAPVKSFEGNLRGRGASSNWRLRVNYLERAGFELPEDGVPFSVLVTIRDPRGDAPVFQEMRQTLQSTGIRTADIRTAARVSNRV
jgi:hypothetical protein